MNMDSAAIFLASSILLALGFVALIIAVVFINNVLHKYWKPVNLFTPDSWKAFNPPPQFMNKEDVDKMNKDKKNERTLG